MLIPLGDSILAPSSEIEHYQFIPIVCISSTKQRKEHCYYATEPPVDEVQIGEP